MESSSSSVAYNQTDFTANLLSETRSALVGQAIPQELNTPLGYIEVLSMAL